MKQNYIVKLFVLCLVQFLCYSGKAYSQSKDEQMILEVMRLEEKTWNAGDIEGYVDLYAPEDSARMILGKGEARGKESILAFYKKYWPKEKMGKLILDGERMERISDEYYFVSGYFHVTTVEGKEINGRYSSLMKKIKGKWYIYTDHSS